MTVLATAGTTPLVGSLVVLALIAASVGIFFALNRSLKRMRRTFDERDRPPPS